MSQPNICPKCGVTIPPEYCHACEGNNILAESSQSDHNGKDDESEGDSASPTQGGGVR